MAALVGCTESTGAYMSLDQAGCTKLEKEGTEIAIAFKLGNVPENSKKLLGSNRKLVKNRT